jgi:hypothetical protein
MHRKMWECTARRRRKQAKKSRVEAVGRDSVGSTWAANDSFSVAGYSGVEEIFVNASALEVPN